jgi:hypothetical protein
VTSRTVGIGVLIVATVISWMPLLALLLSIGIASALGCRLDEASVHPCKAAGMDLGPALSDGFISGWLLLFVWPVMLITLVAWIVLLVRMLARKNRARAAQAL